MSSLPDWDVPPLYATPVAPDHMAGTRGWAVVETGEGICRVTKDSIGGRTGDLLVFRPWQSRLTAELFAVNPATGRYTHRTALIGVPRKNGKSAWLAVIALDQLLFGPEGGELYSCAADREQAKLVFNVVRRMIELDPELTALLEVHKSRNEIVNPTTGTIYRALSAEAFTKEGLNPTVVLFDEVHAQPNRELWDVMALAQGARREPLLIGITTAGVRTDNSGKDSLCYGLYQYGQQVASGEVDDETFYMAWWAAPDGADHRDPAVWAAANPGYGDLVSEEDFASQVKRTPEAEFRTKRLNQWVAAKETWLPSGAWDGLTTVDLPDDATLVLGFDGSFNNDSTALTAVTIPEDDETKPIVAVLGLWERPEGANEDWQVPVLEVEGRIREVCEKYEVREIACDPARWARSYQVLEEEGLPVVSFPQSASRMVPATQRFYEAVVNDQVQHDGNPSLARHLDNCAVKRDQRGARLTKETRFTSRKIDLAVAAVMALDRAAWHQANGPANYDVLTSVY